MFYDLNLTQLNKIKDRFYPRGSMLSGFLKSVVVNDYGTENKDTTLRVVLSIKDGLEQNSDGEQVFKIFDNEVAKKYLKMKLFEVLSPNMLDELAIFQEIEQIEAIISKYGAQYRDYIPSLDFIGDKTNPDAHIKLNNPANALELIYDTTFLLPREAINFLSLGVIFYFDKQQYLEDQKIDKNFIDQRILIDGLLVYNLFVDGKAVSTLAPVQDLRISSSVVNSRKLLNRLGELNLSKALKSRLAKTNKKYFSNCYLSRNFDNTAGISFTVDFESIIKNNSLYSELFERSELKDELLRKCKITNVTVKRRTTKKYGNNKYIHSPNTETTIISSGEEKNSTTVLERLSDTGYLTEIDLNTSNNKYLRSFLANDRKIFADTTGLQQYGAEITISDGINDFLKNYADSLGIHIVRMREYLEETNKLVRISQDGTYNFSVQGSYDPQKNAFTPDFLSKFDLPRGSRPSFKDIILDSASSFVATLILLGLEDRNAENLKRSLLLMLHPRTTSAETIIYFISLYETVISEIYRLIENNYNTSYTVHTWFTNDFIDASQSIKTGYYYFDPSSYKGLALIRSIDYTNRITSEVNRFRSGGSIDLGTAGSKVLSYLSPNNIFTNSLHLPLLNLTADAESVSNYDFMQGERDIKTNTLKNLAVNVDSNINYFEELLSLALVKQYNSSKATYNQQVTNTATLTPPTIPANFITKDTIKQLDVPTSPAPPTAPVVQSQIQESDQVPHQLNALLDDACRLLKASDNYRQSLEHLSKYNLLFNTIHAVEILEYKNGTLDENWKLVTSDNLQNLITERIFLCRLREYKNSTFGVAGLDEIKLPIYNKYFLLSNSIFTTGVVPEYVDMISNLVTTIRNDFVVRENSLTNTFQVNGLLDQLNLTNAPEESTTTDVSPTLTTIDIVSSLPVENILDRTLVVIEPTILTALAPDLLVTQPTVTATQPEDFSSTNTTTLTTVTSLQPTIPNMDLISSTVTAPTLSQPVLSSPTTKLLLQTTQPILSPIKLTNPF